MSGTDNQQSFSAASASLKDTAFSRRIKTSTQCIQHAEGLWAKGQRGTALECLIAGLMRHPNHIKLACHTAFRLSVFGRHHEAEALLLSRLGAVSDEKVLTALLNVYRRAENMEKTVSTAHTIMEISKGDPHSPHTVANALLQACHHGEAIMVASNGLARDPDDQKLKRSLADGYLGVGATGAFAEVHDTLPPGTDKTYLHAKYLWLMNCAEPAKLELVKSIAEGFDERSSILMVAILGENLSNPLVGHIHKMFYSSQNDQRFEDLFKGAERMRTARNRVIQITAAPGSPVLSGPYTIHGAVNGAARRDAGYRAGTISSHAEP